MGGWKFSFSYFSDFFTGREDSVPRTTEFYSCLIHHCYPGPNFLIKPTPLHPAIELVLQYLHVTYSSFFLLLLHLHSSSNLQLLLSSYNQSSYTQFQRHHTPTETIWQKSPSIASAVSTSPPHPQTSPIHLKQQPHLQTT